MLSHQSDVSLLSAQSKRAVRGYRVNGAALVALALVASAVQRGR